MADESREGTEWISLSIHGEWPQGITLGSGIGSPMV